MLDYVWFYFYFFSCFDFCCLFSIRIKYRYELLYLEGEI